MPKKRKDVTFDGDISKGGSSGKVEDPNLINNNENNVPNSNSDDNNSSNQGIDEDNSQSPQPENEPNSEDSEKQSSGNDQSDNDSNKVTEQPNQNKAENGDGKVNDSSSEPSSQQNSDDNSGSDNATNKESGEEDNNTKPSENDSQQSGSKLNSENHENGEDDNTKDDKTFNSEDEDEGNTFSPEDSEEDSSNGGLIGKALGTSDIANTAAKAKKLKDISKMSKEEAKEHLESMAVEAGKAKAKAAIWSAISPYLLPIIGIILALVLILIMIFGIVSSTSDSNKGNDQGCETMKKGSTDVKNSKDAEKNAETIYKYLMKHVDGAKSKAVAGHLGNIYVESAQTFDPSTIQGGDKFKEDIAMDESAGGYAFGISQWDSGRRVNLIKFAKKKKKKWSDLGIQLDFMLNHDGSDSETIKKLLKSDDGIDKSTENIMNEWERAGDKDSIGERKSAASKYYSKFSDKDSESGKDSNVDDATDAATDNSDAAENSGCEKGGSSGSGKIGKSVKANDKSGEVKEKWSSKDKIPQKYRKHIKLPDFKEHKLDSSDDVLTGTGDKGQCTELTWAYMSELWKGKQPTNGNGNVIYKAYKSQGAKTTANPTVGYGFSSDPPYAGAATSDVGHTGVVVAVLDDGKWIMANYNLNGEAPKRELTYALVDGNKKKGGTTFFSGIGGKK